MRAVHWMVTVPLLVAGCASSPPRQSAVDEVPNSGLDSLSDPASRSPNFLPPPDLDAPPENDLARLAAQAAIDLERLMASGAMSREAAPAAVNEPEPEVPQVVALVESPSLPPIEAEPAEPQAPFDPLLDLAQRMAGLLRTPLEGRPRIPDAVALAPIEAMEPGVLADIESPANHLGVRLSPEDRQALVTARDNVLANPTGTSESLARALARLAPVPALKIPRAALCTRVSGFGHFEPYPSSTFLRGQPIRAIVYVELEGFTARPARPSDPIQTGVALAEQVSVDLQQSLTLYQDPSGLLSWHRPAKPVIETSRNKRRDFYLIQQIELPGTLSIGRYNLKVTVRDRTTAAEAEAIIPISIVADRSAIR